MTTEIGLAYATLSDMASHTIDQVVAGAVRAELARRGMSQLEAAHYIGLGIAAFRRRTAGATPFSAAELVALAELLGIEPAQLLPARRAA